MVNVRVDGKLFSIRIKEASGWTPSFNTNIPKVEVEDSDGEVSLENIEKEDGNSSLNDKDESLDPFGIYETMERMKEEERRSKMPTGFKGWGKSKNQRNSKVELEGQNGNKFSENLFYTLSEALMVEKIRDPSPDCSSANLLIHKNQNASSLKDVV
ncbi:unnamed protein product [Lactuca saligna]|uniref:Uncharacterized protein n=1 Tax=Lactuca saligna TaxID=75948 RepID=A0AA35Z1F3_LACSI|nr:unnamed protein product [Lactuca saligna]